MKQLRLTSVLMALALAVLAARDGQGLEPPPVIRRLPDAAPRNDVIHLPGVTPLPDAIGPEIVSPPLPSNRLPVPGETLPSLEEELWLHGGSYLYHPEGDRLNWPAPHSGQHYELFRLPEDWRQPEPVTAFAEFLGSDPVRVFPGEKWPGPSGYLWDKRFVGYGGYQLFAFALEENNRRQDVVGHQLLVDLDLQLTGTERFHVQYRPLGEQNTGGSYYQFSDPSGYIDNATAVPDRYWFDGEVHSMLGSFLNPFAVWDYHFTLGKFPFVLQNGLLINDDILGVAVNKNTIYLGTLSNLNVIAFSGLDDVDAFADADGRVIGLHASADYRQDLYEASYAFLEHQFDSRRDQHFLAFSGTHFHGPLTVTLRTLVKLGDRGGRGSGELYVAELNRTRSFDSRPLGVAYGVFYLNAFHASKGWNSISGGNFNRLTTAFEVNPLVRISAGRLPVDTAGLAAGVQLFRHHEDESLIPEMAVQTQAGKPVWGVGLRYLRKTGPRSFFELLSILNVSEDSRFDRQGVFVSETVLF